jgi:hypothetical protein
MKKKLNRRDKWAIKATKEIQKQNVKIDRLLKKCTKEAKEIEGADCLFESEWLKKVTDKI